MTNPTSAFIDEASRKTKVAEEADVIVCGGGPAGVCAAIAAARMGLSTRLIEAGGCLGGIWTSGLMSYVIDHENKDGLLREILRTLEAMGAKGPKATFDIEAMKYLLESLCADAGARIRLHTRAAATLTNGENQLDTVITESKSGREAWRAKVFIDCTGDGDVAALAGCGYDMGRDGNGECQPMSMSALICGVDADAMPEFIKDMNGADSRKALLLDTLRKAGVEPSYAKPTLFQVHKDVFLLMSNHEYGVPADDAEAITKATIAGRAEVYRQIEALRMSGGVWQNLRLVGTSSHIGVREGRRIHGHYTITLQDLLEGRGHEDAVCTATFCVDIHATNPADSKGYGNDGHRVKPYGIPLRSLIAKDVDGLLMAGRCISGDFHAHASYRVTGNAAAMGEAAGVAAAVSAKAGTLPRQTPWQAIAPHLDKQRKLCASRS